VSKDIVGIISGKNPFRSGIKSRDDGTLDHFALLYHIWQFGSVSQAGHDDVVQENTLIHHFLFFLYWWADIPKGFPTGHSGARWLLRQVIWAHVVEDAAIRVTFNR
jgi:hypothetical protein